MRNHIEKRLPCLAEILAPLDDLPAGVLVDAAVLALGVVGGEVAVLGLGLVARIVLGRVTFIYSDMFAKSMKQWSPLISRVLELHTCRRQCGNRT